LILFLAITLGCPTIFSFFFDVPSKQVNVSVQILIGNFLEMNDKNTLQEKSDIKSRNVV